MELVSAIDSCPSLHRGRVKPCPIPPVGLALPRTLTGSFPISPVILRLAWNTPPSVVPTGHQPVGTRRVREPSEPRVEVSGGALAVLSDRFTARTSWRKSAKEFALHESVTSPNYRKGT